MRLAFIADIHEDVVSLKKALRMVEREKCDQLICLGDIMGYPFLRGKYEATRNLAECISLIRQNCSVVVLGNHDFFHLQKFPRFSSGFRFQPDWYTLSADEKRKLAGDKVWNYADDYPVELSEKDAAYLSTLPEYDIHHFGGKKILLSHYVYPNFSGYVLLQKSEGRKILDHFRFLKEHECELSVFGHLHVEGIALHYEPREGTFARLLNGFDYFSFGEKKLKDRLCSISIPALADNGQVNGFAILDTEKHSINALSLNVNRRFIL